jgi:hypothetical protein
MSNRQKTNVYLSGGLGNQLFQIAAGIRFGSSNLVFNTSQLKNEFVLQEFLCVLSKKLGFTANIENKSPRFLFLKFHNLLIRSSQMSDSSSSSKKVLHIMIFLSFFFAGANPKKIITDSHIGVFSLKKRKISKPKYIIGYFQDESNAILIKSLLNEYLDSLPDKYVKDSDINSNQDLIIHIRRGDYENELKIGMLSNDYFRLVFEEVLCESKVSQIRFFTNGKVDFGVISGNIYKGKVLEDLENEPLAILAKMRNGSQFIISNSTLSWWAAYLCRDNKKVVYAPTPWFRRLDEPVNFVPNSWKRFPADWN